jgi:hypothetical protein
MSRFTSAARSTWVLPATMLPPQPLSRQSAVKVRYSARMISVLPLLCWRQLRASDQP